MKEVYVSDIWSTSNPTSIDDGIPVAFSKLDKDRIDVICPWCGTSCGENKIKTYADLIRTLTNFLIPHIRICPDFKDFPNQATLIVQDEKRGPKYWKDQFGLKVKSMNAEEIESSFIMNNYK